MANIVRGFRRLGWLLTVPVAALFVLVFLERTKEFSASSYEATSREDPYQKYGGSIDLEQTGEKAIEIPGLGYAYFLKGVPPEVANKVVADFARNQRRNREADSTQKADGTKVPQTLEEALKAGGRVIAHPPDTPHGPWEIYQLGDFAALPESERQKVLAAKPNDEMLHDFEALPETERQKVLAAINPPQALRDLTASRATGWQFTVHKRINKLKLTGLIIAAITIPALVIQGLISVLAWVVRGFGHT